ncbi:MAG: glycosyltransferase family 9 protein [Anaerovibrio sp.]|uniref:glycosyltransferase family 9 protein n=1 Tax=Anaerovibrio sp. TaxID=1872532 RepID=UPI0025E48FD0|nr:glycosyltransferase family 9 protein [Anaerovibrio sp.]MCR5176521.1 glycosyltransferase family 9 protein [Anaerovibrio sp.]
MRDIQSVLVVKLSAIGDVIHALPVSYAIKETYPDARVTWVVEPPAYDILKDNPYIDRIIVFEKKKFKSLKGFIKNYGPFTKILNADKYDVSLDLQGLFKSAAIAWAAKAPLRLGTCNMREMSHKISRPVVGRYAQGHIVERYLDVVREMGCKVQDVVFPMEISDSDCNTAINAMNHAGAHMDNPYVVLAVGANWPNKRWPTRYYAQLSDWLYGQKIIPVIIGGGALDAQLAADIEGAVEIPPINMVGKTTLKQLAYVIKNACAVVGGDTGPVHLSAGLGVDTIMVMGPTDANRNGPYGQLDNAIECNRPCRYCWKRACPKGLDCLSVIHPEDVEKKLDIILRKHLK